jgi:hypothetical protein
MQQRIFTGKQHKMDVDEKEDLKKKKLDERWLYEKDRMGGYELIYPSAEPKVQKQYVDMLKKANDLWDVFTTGKTGNIKKSKDMTEAKKQQS